MLKSREERLYDREAVLGRDTSSVFPSETKKLGKMDKDAAAAVLGSMQFVTESQVVAPVPRRLLMKGHAVILVGRPCCNVHQMPAPSRGQPQGPALPISAVWALAGKVATDPRPRWDGALPLLSRCAHPSY